ncbi:MAG: ATP-binding protein [Geobacteraceae bacterium]|nr:ATP-binding protein [Geobacteraceae bacterium]
MCRKSSSPSRSRRGRWWVRSMTTSPVDNRGISPCRAALTSAMNSMAPSDRTKPPRHENVIFLAPPGVSKTHLATAPAFKARYQGFSAYFATRHALIAQLKESQAKGKAHLNSCRVIVPVVGCLPVTGHEAYLFFQFATCRNEEGSTIIASNKSYSDWQELSSNPVIASLIPDRILYHCQAINIQGQGY